MQSTDALTVIVWTFSHASFVISSLLSSPFILSLLSSSLCRLSSGIIVAFGVCSICPEMVHAVVVLALEVMIGPIQVSIGVGHTVASMHRSHSEATGTRCA